MLKVAFQLQTTKQKDQFTIMIGYNDFRNKGASVSVLTHFQYGLESAIAWLALPNRFLNKITAKHSSVSYSGTWSDSGLYSTPTVTARESSTQNDTATFNVFGKTIYVCLGNVTTGTGVCSITVDGAVVGLYDCFGTHSSSNGTTYNSRLVRIPNLGDTTHTVIITVTTAGKVPFIWAGGTKDITSLNSPNIYVGNVIKMTDLGYAGYSNGYSDATVASYNTTIANAIQTFSGDGLNIAPVDVSGNYDPNSGLTYTDDHHPNNAGHQNIAASFIAAIETSYRRISQIV
jgi:lysophospholipase L1-like esterase